MITPPVGINLFVVQGVREHGQLHDVMLGAAPFVLTLLVMVVLGGAGARFGAMLGGFFYTLLDYRLRSLSGEERIQDLPDVLRIPLSEPLFLLGALFIAVVFFVPGGLASLPARVRQLTQRRRAREATP